jgi:hypothetical protein
VTATWVDGNPSRDFMRDTKTRYGTLLEYGAQDGPLFVQGEGDSNPVSPTDVRQVGLGDCFLMASVGSVASRDPKVIQDMIHDNGNGTYTVTFHRPAPISVPNPHPAWKFWEPDTKTSDTVQITVDNRFPVSKQDGSVAFAQPGDPSVPGSIPQSRQLCRRTSSPRPSGGCPRARSP